MIIVIVMFLINILNVIFLIRAREAAGGCCMSGCCKLSKNEKSERDSAGADCATQMKDTVKGCCPENRK